LQKGRAGLLPRPGTLSPSALLSCWTSPAHVYDAFGNRIERLAWDGATTTHERFVQDGWATDKPVAVGNENFDTILDLDGSNALVTRRVTGDGFDDLIARISSAGTVGWYITDRQGSGQSIPDSHRRHTERDLRKQLIAKKLQESLLKPWRARTTIGHSV